MTVSIRYFLTKKKITLLGLLLIFAFLVFFSFHQPKIKSAAITAKNQPDYRFESVTITHLERGHRLWSLRAETAAWEKEINKTELRDTHARIYEEDQPIMHIDAPNATLDFQNSRFVMSNAHISLTTPHLQGDIDCQILEWDPINEMILGRNQIVFTNDQMDISGKLLKVAIPVKNIQISQEGVATLRL